MEKKALKVEGKSFLDYDIDAYCFISVNQVEKDAFIAFKYLEISEKIMENCPYDVIHNVANEYFHRFCAHNKGFTHLTGSKNDYLIGYLYIKYNKSDSVDVKTEIDCINNLLLEFDLNKVWGKVTHLVGRKTGHCMAYFFIDYSSNDPIDVHFEMLSINDIIK